MKRTGKIKTVFKDFETDRIVVAFELFSAPDDLDDLTRCEKLVISAEKFREQRSRNANAYFHVLAGKIAEKLGTKLDHEKNRLIREYGQYLYINGQIPTMETNTAYEDRILDEEGVHVKPIDRPAPDRVRLAFMRGSKTYNTAEMARLIDGTVEQAKELGIETLTPAELERMKAAW